MQLATTEVDDVKYPARRPNGRVRFTFHLHEAVLEKLRDAVAFIQGSKSEKTEFHNETESLSSFVEREVILAVDRIEQKLGKPIPPRNTAVHFGRPKSVNG